MCLHKPVFKPSGPGTRSDLFRLQYLLEAEHVVPRFGCRQSQIHSQALQQKGAYFQESMLLHTDPKNQNL